MHFANQLIVNNSCLPIGSNSVVSVLQKWHNLKISRPADVSYSIFYVKDALWKNVAAQPQHGKMIRMFTVNVQCCCFEMAAEVCSHQSVTIFKLTLLHQDGSVPHQRASKSSQISNLFVINRQKLQTCCCRRKRKFNWTTNNQSWVRTS